MINKLKRAIKKRLRTDTEVLIEKSIASNISGNYSLDEYAHALLKRIKFLLKEENDSLNKEVKLVAKYIKTITGFARFQLDSGEDNEIIALLTEHFLSTEVFSNKRRTTALVTELIIANNTIHKIKTGYNLMSKFYVFFDFDEKIDMLTRITTSFSAKASINLMEELIKEREKKDFLLLMNPTKELEEKEFDDELRRQRKYSYLLYRLMMNRPKNIQANTFLLQVAIQRKMLTNEVVYLAMHMVNNGDEVYLNILKKLCDSFLGNERLRNIQSYVEDKENRGIVRVNQRNPLILNQSKAYEMFINLFRMDVDKRNSKYKIYEYAKFALEAQRRKFEKEMHLDYKLTIANRYISVKSKVRALRFWRDFEMGLNKIDFSKKSNTILLLVNDYSLVNGALLFPFAMSARKHKDIVLPLCPLIMSPQDVDDKELFDMVGNMVSDDDYRYNRKLPVKYKWTIDIENKKIVNEEGINIYQSIFEIITRYQFTYKFDWQDVWVRAKTKSLIDYHDRILQYCHEIYAYNEKHKKNIKFISNAPHIFPASVYRIFCEHSGYKNNMEFICLSPGYDNYFNNMGDVKTETISALNLTRNLASRNSFLGTKDGFEAFMEKNSEKLPEYVAEAEKWLSYKRSHLADSYSQEKKKEILETIQRYKQEHKKVVLLNGKVVFDLAVKETVGVVHKDMTDWLNHTIQIANENPDILLLIKPHPHEQRKDLTMTSDEVVGLKNLIQVEMKENVIYLDNEAFNIFELVDDIDTGIVWNGTSILELTAQGIPVLTGDTVGLKDYPIGLYEVADKEDYQEKILSKNYATVSKSLRDKAIFFLKYMGSEDVRIPNPYSETTSMNYNQFDKSKIHNKAVNEYLKNGDVLLDELYESIIYGKSKKN